MTPLSQHQHAARLSIAPMMDWTDRHCRYFHRLLAPQALLYTEMVTTGALLHGDVERHLGNHPAEHPLALQLGGCVPAELAQACKIAAQFGFDEINLNVGCPSPRVQRGAFGACLMAEPELVRDCCAAMIEAVPSIPVTVKTRIGIDDSAEWDFFECFVDTVAQSGVETFIVHARKAWLKGLSPKENREVPPLNYEQVFRLKRERPELTVVINGGITDPEAAAKLLQFTDGVMIGRQAYHEPASLPSFSAALQDTGPGPEPFEVLAAMADYAAQRMDEGTPFRAIARHLLGLFNGRPGARAFRRMMSETMGRPDAGPWVLQAAAEPLRQAA